jgi:YD repeat-containing protein
LSLPAEAPAPAATTGEGGWSQGFGYYGFGNLLSQTVTRGNAPSLSVNRDPATHRIPNAGISYEANGNLTEMPGLTMTYDVFVSGFDRNYGELAIRSTSGVVCINGNAGGQVDPATGRLIPGTDLPCEQPTYRKPLGSLQRSPQLPSGNYR